jgi:hypothetical protein
MKNLNYNWTFKLLAFIFFLALFTTQTSCKRKIEAKSVERQKILEEYIDSMLIDSVNFNEIDNKKIIIKTESQFVSIIEPILFDIYGKEQIIDERPYEVYFVKNYWIISGYLPPNVEGVYFEAIMDARNCEIIRIEHGE